jgi:O-acetylhomoserine (thiol)-lyase
VKNPKRARSTTALHGGYAGDGATGATAVPIYQTVAYAYRTARELEEAFAGTAPGYIYTRIANPTTAVLEARLAELEGGIGCVATASGMAAIASVATALLRSGDGILAARGIFGGTWSLFARTLARFGVTTRMESAADAGRFAAAITPRTRMVFVESVANPGMDVPDLSAIAREAHRAGLPLVVDATAATPFLCRPGEFGADLVVHSTSKFINGHGTAIGGAIIDTGAFDWTAGPFADLAELAKTDGLPGRPAPPRVPGPGRLPGPHEFVPDAPGPRDAGGADGPALHERRAAGGPAGGDAGRGLGPVPGSSG